MFFTKTINRWTTTNIKDCKNWVDTTTHWYIKYQVSKLSMNDFVKNNKSKIEQEILAYYNAIWIKNDSIPF